MFKHAVVRRPGPDFAFGITSANLGAPDYELLLRQHQEYVDILIKLGLLVRELPALASFPDACFVEDTAVVTADVAVISRPGAAARRGEELAMQPELARCLPTRQIQPPGTLDGGDVLQLGTHFFIGLSERTNRSGAEQLGRILQQYGCIWTPVPVSAGLHLKSSVNGLGADTLLVTAAFAGRPEFDGYEQIIVPAGEEHAANTLWINDSLLIPAGAPKTRLKLQRLGLPLIELDVSEVRKMDGGLTCMSLRF